jgi:hypothetical protein
MNHPSIIACNRYLLAHLRLLNLPLSQIFVKVSKANVVKAFFTKGLVVKGLVVKDKALSANAKIPDLCSYNETDTL